MTAPRFRRRATAPRRSRFRRFLSGSLAMGILFVLALAATRLDRVGTLSPAGKPVISDGDSLKFGDERIRMRGIDAPEYTQTCTRAGKAYACGREARAELARLAAGGAVTCTGWERDRYGRLLAVCTSAGRELNKAMVESGWAVSYGGYKAEEDRARLAKRGLWAGEFDRPQHWRATHGDLADSEHDFWAMLRNLLAALLGLS